MSGIPSYRPGVDPTQRFAVQPRLIFRIDFRRALRIPTRAAMRHCYIAGCARVPPARRLICFRCFGQLPHSLQMAIRAAFRAVRTVAHPGAADAALRGLNRVHQEAADFHDRRHRESQARKIARDRRDAQRRASNIAPAYEIAADGQSILCHRCGLCSYHPEDVKQRFCVQCGIWHDLLPTGPTERGNPNHE